MIVLDANILLYAYGSASAYHAKARAWVESTFSGRETVGLPWRTIAAFLRISTNPRLPGERFMLEQAVETVDSWLGQPNIQLPAPGEDHWPRFREMITAGKAPAN